MWAAFFLDCLFCTTGLFVYLHIYTTTTIIATKWVLLPGRLSPSILSFKFTFSTVIPSCINCLILSNSTESLMLLKLIYVLTWEKLTLSSHCLPIHKHAIYFHLFQFFNQDYNFVKKYPTLPLFLKYSATVRYLDCSLSFTIKYHNK